MIKTYNLTIDYGEGYTYTHYNISRIAVERYKKYYKETDRPAIINILVWQSLS